MYSILARKGNNPPFCLRARLFRPLENIYIPLCWYGV